MTEHPYDGAEGRPLPDLVIKGMSVVDREGTHVGTVDKVEGGHLKILRPDQRPRNQHQYVTPNWIVALDDRVRLNLTLMKQSVCGPRSRMQSDTIFIGRG